MSLQAYVEHEFAKQYLLEYLVDGGIPKSTIVFEWQVRPGIVVDLAIIDPETQKPLIVFEIKSKLTEETKRTAESQLDRYAAALSDPRTLYFAVFPSGPKIEPIKFFMYSRADRTLEPLPTDMKRLSSSIRVLMNTSTQKEIKDKTDKRKNVTSIFHLLCWGLGCLLVLLLILDFSQIISLTPIRVTVIGLIVVLILAPYATEVSILGNTIKRLKNGRKYEDKG